MLFKHLFAAALTLSVATCVQAQIKVGVITSATGPTALVGIPQKNTVPLLTPGVSELTVQYIYMDDASDPGKSVAAVKKLIAENNIDALIGPSGSPNAIAMIPVIAQAGVPMLAPAGTAAVVLPMTEQKKWVFKTTQNDSLIAAALVERMVKMKFRTVAYIGTNDAYGENWGKVFADLAKKNNLRLVANERFQRSDEAVTAQTQKIIAAHPDAVLIGAAGGPTLLPQTTLYDLGYKGQIFQTHGAALPAFLNLGGKKVEGTILAAGMMLVLPEIADSNPSKKVAEEYIGAYENLNGSKPATFGANVYDAGLLLERAIPSAAKKARPGTRQFRAALRDALEHTKDLVGTQGVYNMTATDHSGFDFRARELIVVKNGEWHLLK